MERHMGEWGELAFFLCEDKGSYKNLAISDTWVVAFDLFTLDLCWCISVYHITI